MKLGPGRFTYQWISRDPHYYDRSGLLRDGMSQVLLAGGIKHMAGECQIQTKGSLRDPWQAIRIPGPGRSRTPAGASKTAQHRQGAAVRSSRARAEYQAHGRSPGLPARRSNSGKGQNPGPFH